MNYVGFSSLEVLTCATKNGATLLGRSHEIGTIEPGKLADLLIVDGDPVADITVLEKRDRFIAVLQGGVIRAGQLATPG